MRIMKNKSSKLLQNNQILEICGLEIFKKIKHKSILEKSKNNLKKTKNA